MSCSITAGAVIYATDLDRLAEFYAGALQFQIVMRDSQHVVLTANSFELVLLKRESAANPVESDSTIPRPRRSEAAVKPVFVIDSIASARVAAPPLGGIVNAVAHEWRFGPYQVCDALDPDGNVLQLRQYLPDDSRDGAA